VDDSSDQIATHIRSTRRELSSNLHELESRVRDVADWRVQFERHPLALLGVAFAGGILLSAAVGGGRRWRPESDRRVLASGPHPGRAIEGNLSPSHIWRSVKEALGSAVGRQIHTMLGEFVPGVREDGVRAASPGASVKQSRPSVFSTNGGDEERQPPRM
jgi:hypothetical protein